MVPERNWGRSLSRRNISFTFPCFGHRLPNHPAQLPTSARSAQRWPHRAETLRWRSGERSLQTLFVHAKIYGGETVFVEFAPICARGGAALAPWTPSGRHEQCGRQVHHGRHERHGGADGTRKVCMATRMATEGLLCNGRRIGLRRCKRVTA